VQDRQLLAKASGYALLLLRYRQRSESELRQRLKRKGFEESVIEQTLLFLKEHHFVDDCQFARFWIQARLNKPLGINRIILELRQKGVNQDIIKQELSEIKLGYDEKKAIKTLASKRLRLLKKTTDPKKAKARVFSFLVRRGFSPEVVAEVINSQNYEGGLSA